MGSSLLLPTFYLCKHLWQAGNHLGSSKLKSKQTKIPLCLWVNVWGVYTRPLQFRNHVPDFSADLALFTHSESDFGSDSGGIISIKWIQIQPLQLMNPKRETGISQANVINY